jgi:hypothetical protein
MNWTTFIDVVPLGVKVDAVVMGCSYWNDSLIVFYKDAKK